MTTTAEKVLLLRTCDAQMRSHGGFRWPESGPVECPDWDAVPRCSGGLHGLLWGEGDGALLSWGDDARWLVVEADARDVVDLEGKVKVPRGVVVFCGSREDATRYIVERAPGRAVVGAQISAGDYGTATAGDGGTATAGDDGTATAGDDGTATAGDYGTATAGDGGTATAGDDGVILLSRWDGKRRRIVVGYIGEDGLEPRVAYRLDEEGRIVRATVEEVQP